MVTERISTKLGHISTYDCYLKNVVRIPQAFSPHGLGRQMFFFWGGGDFEFDQTPLQRYMISTIGKKIVNLQGPPTCPNLANFGPEMAGDFLPTP